MTSPSAFQSVDPFPYYYFVIFVLKSQDNAIFHLLLIIKKMRC